jgi:hypothetical protein
MDEPGGYQARGERSMDGLTPFERGKSACHKVSGQGNVKWFDKAACGALLFHSVTTACMTQIKSPPLVRRQLL